MNHQPPRLAQRLFAWLSGSAHVDDLLGDLEERFYLNVAERSPFRAKVQYWKDVFSLSFSYALKKRKRDARFAALAGSTFSVDMLHNYMKVAIRNLYQYKYFSVLNAFGLAIGMSVSLLLISIYSDVSTYDNFHEHRKNIYTIESTRSEGVEELGYATAPIVLADKVEEEFTGVDRVVRIVKAYNNQVKTEKENIPVKGYYVEPDFFSVFTFEIIQGSASALNKSNQVILTESAATKLFNSVDVVGKTIELEGGSLMEVAGVMKDHPRNSHLTFEMLLSFESLPAGNLSLQDKWVNYPQQYVYVLLNEKGSQADLQSYLDKLSGEVYEQAPAKVTFSLQHLEGIASGEDLHHAIGVKWEASGFLLFGVFAALILLPACFNYTNISIARALRRSKEIGLRKAMGGVRSQIFFQFITETVVITFLSLAGAIFIFILIRSEFQSMMVAGASLDLSLTTRMIFLFIIFALITGLVAGIFPAMHFAGLNPIEALKSKINPRGSSMRLRRVLSIFQFALSFGFILSLVVFSRQYRHSINFDFGFERENTVDVELRDVEPDLFKSVFSRLAPVQSVSMSSGLLGVGASRTWVHNHDNDSTEVAQHFVDASYVPNFGLTMLAGENFPAETWTREKYIIVNEEFLKGYAIENPAEGLGKTFKVDGADLEVIGVLKNFHYEPLIYPIGRFFFRMNPSQYQYANLRVTSTDAFTMFSQMEQAWKELPTHKKFAARYFEDELQEAYQMYTALLKIIGFLGLLAITISLLGMLGMVVYTSETKTKEVGIRKVMGASAGSIAYLLSKDYLKMMAWAILFAIPVTGFLLNELLPKMQYYSIKLSAWDIVVSAFILVLLGISTITSKTWQTAMSNPAETLRTE